MRQLLKQGVDWRNDKKKRSPTELGNPDWPPEKISKYRKTFNQIVSEYGLNPEKRIPEQVLFLGKLVDLPKRVEAAINAVRDNRKASGKRYIAPPPKKLSNGQRKKIIADLARTYEVTERRIRTILET